METVETDAVDSVATEAQDAMVPAVVTRPATTAKSPVTSPESAAREEDQEADPSSKYPFLSYKSK